VDYTNLGATGPGRDGMRRLEERYVPHPVLGHG
jgi:hypothetical protein